MSTGISVICEPEIDDLEGYFQELAAVYEELSALLKNEGVDILPYLFCPESDLSDEEIEKGCSTILALLDRYTPTPVN